MHDFILISKILIILLLHLNSINCACARFCNKVIKHCTRIYCKYHDSSYTKLNACFFNCHYLYCGSFFTQATLTEGSFQCWVQETFIHLDLLTHQLLIYWKNDTIPYDNLDVAIKHHINYEEEPWNVYMETSVIFTQW